MSVFRDVRMQSCLALRFLVTRRPPLHEIFAFRFFQTSDRGWPACGCLGRQTSARTKTSARLKITFVDMTYLKGWTGSLPRCPLIFSWKFMRSLSQNQEPIRSKNLFEYYFSAALIHHQSNISGGSIIL